MKRVPTILLIYSGFHTFVKADYEILKREFNVIRYHYETYRQLFPFIFEFLKILSYLVMNFHKVDIIYSWFCDYHTALPALFARVFKKKSVIIVGGYDAVCISEIKYGIFFKRDMRALLARFSYKIVDHIVAVDASLIKGVHSYFSDKKIKIGVTNFVKNIEKKCQTVPTGYDYNKWKRLGTVKKEKIVLSIGAAYDKKNFQRKGFDLLIEIAKEMPHVRFTIIGLKDEALEYARQIASRNVAVLGYVPNDDLINYYSCSKVFCQLSLNEGLPNTLCEAMLCECIPVGSSVNGIPSAIANTGFILKKRDRKKAIELIQNALESDEKLGVRARERIINHFSLETRSEAILKILKSN